MAFDPATLRLCLVTDRDIADGRSLIDIVAAAVQGGATMVQLREKLVSTRDFLEQARMLKAMLAPHAVPLIVNDRIDIALAVDADGAHVGQSDMPVDEARRLLGPDKIVGLSIVEEGDMARADAAAADYLGVGPIYAQTTKPDATPPLGVEGFRRIRILARRPVVAIGGLTPSNSGPLLAAGADGLAVVSAIVGAADPRAAAQSFAGLVASRR